MRKRKISPRQLEKNGEVKDFPSESCGVLDYMKTIPSVRKEKVLNIQRLLATGQWLPQSKKIADKILNEHLLRPV